MYGTLYPETKHEAFKGNQHVANLATTKNPRFTQETVRATGRSERSVRRDAQRSEALVFSRSSRATWRLIDRQLQRVHERGGHALVRAPVTLAGAPEPPLDGCGALIKRRVHRSAFALSIFSSAASQMAWIGPT